MSLETSALPTVNHIKIHPQGDAGEPFEDLDIPYDAEAVALREKEQRKREEILASTIMYAHILMARSGTETQVDAATLQREYSWPTMDGRHVYKLQERGTPASSGHGKRWEQPLVFSVAEADAADDTYLTRVNLSRTSVNTQPRYADNRFMGETDDDALFAIWQELDTKVKVEGGLRNMARFAARAAGVAAAAEAHIAELTARNERMAEVPSLQMSDSLLHRLRLANQAHGREEVLHTDDGRETFVSADLGVDANGRRFRTLHSSSESTDVLVIDDPETGQALYDILPNGRIAHREHVYENSMFERVELYQRVSQLNSHLVRVMEQGADTAPQLRDRVAMFVDSYRDVLDAQGHILEQPHEFRVGDHEVSDFRITELADRYVVSATVIAPDAQPAHTRRVTFPKDVNGDVYELGAAPDRIDVEELFHQTLTHVLHPDRQRSAEAIASPQRRELGVHDTAFRTANDALADLEFQVHRDPAMPHITRRRTAVVRNAEGRDFLVEQIGRLGHDSELEVAQMSVAVNGQVYELNRSMGFIPEEAYRGGVTPRMSRRVRRQAETDFADFVGALLDQVK